MLILNIIIILISLSTAVGFYNFFTATRLKESTPKSQPLISILIPARNEERNIAKCLQSVTSQNYANYEVIVYNDQSEDNTAEIVKKFKSVKLINGRPLPKDWTGKNHACHNLVNAAKGDYYLFLDADVTIKPNTLQSAVALIEQKEVEMLSCFPCQKINSLGERLVIPIFEWLLLSFVPLDAAYKSKNPFFSIAIGQFILISKKAYKSFGGHESIKNIKSGIFKTLCHQCSSILLKFHNKI